MTISKKQADDFAIHILSNAIRTYCIDNYIEFNEFQLEQKVPYIFTDEEFLQYEREMIELWLLKQ
ncbi:MAG: hypothetical protein ACK5HL_04750 [Bacilli bacterium]